MMLLSRSIDLFTTDGLLSLMTFVSGHFPERQFAEVPAEANWIVHGQGCWVWTNHPDPTDVLLTRVKTIRRAVGREEGTERVVFEVACDVGNGFQVVMRWLGSH